MLKKTRKTATKKPKTVFAGTTHLSVIMDKSGSMIGLQNEIVTGYNQWLKEQQALKDAATLTVTMFDTTRNTLFLDMPLDRVRPLEGTQYVPGGMTALWDAIGQVSKDLEGRIKPGDRVLTMIMTDGMENSSHEYRSLESIRKVIQGYESRGNWTFVFIGANLEAYGGAIGVGTHMGTQAGNNLSYQASAQGVSGVFYDSSVATASYRGGMQGQSANFFDRDRKNFQGYFDKGKPQP